MHNEPHVQGRVKKKTISCNLCGSKVHNVIYADELGDDIPSLDHNFSTQTRKTFQIVKCKQCSLVFTNPMPMLSELYYDTIDRVYVKSSKQRIKTAELTIDRIRRLKPFGKLLDIGCSTGILLDAAAQHFEVAGIETSRWARDEAGKRHLVMDLPLSKLNMKSEYDVVTLFGVIEHFEDPKRELTLMYEALRPGGLLVIYTGDVNSWLARMLGKKWWWYQGMHTYYFSRQTCVSLLRSCGFDVARVEKHSLYFQVRSLGTSLRRYRIGAVLKPIFSVPWVGDIMVKLSLSGEMLIYAVKR
jgi:SAM-dependent methyltransferase